MIKIIVYIFAIIMFFVSNYDYIPLVISFLSLLCSAIDLFICSMLQKENNNLQSKNLDLQEKYNQISRNQKLIASDALMLQIRIKISESYKLVTDAGSALKDKPDDSILQSNYLSKVEAYLNSYEEACAIYLYGYINSKTFHELCRDEILNIVMKLFENEKYELSLKDYRCLKQVYDELKEKK